VVSERQLGAVYRNYERESGHYIYIYIYNIYIYILLKANNDATSLGDLFWRSETITLCRYVEI